MGLLISMSPSLPVCLEFVFRPGLPMPLLISYLDSFPGARYTKNLRTGDNLLCMLLSIVPLIISFLWLRMSRGVAGRERVGTGFPRLFMFFFKMGPKLFQNDEPGVLVAFLFPHLVC